MQIPCCSLPSGSALTATSVSTAGILPVCCPPKKRLSALSKMHTRATLYSGCRCDSNPVGPTCVAFDKLNPNCHTLLLLLLPVEGVADLCCCCC
jgi:hypothetical protein